MDKPWCECGKQFKVGYSKDPDGWWVCANCRKPSRLTLNDCDTCDKKFRRYRQGLKIAVTCPECDE